jgi:hypothetical protein
MTDGQRKDIALLAPTSVNRQLDASTMPEVGSHLHKTKTPGNPRHAGKKNVLICAYLIDLTDLTVCKRHYLVARLDDARGTGVALCSGQN